MLSLLKDEIESGTIKLLTTFKGCLIVFIDGILAMLREVNSVVDGLAKTVVK
jgi:hypothetical protein